MDNKIIEEKLRYVLARKKINIEKSVSTIEKLWLGL